MALFSLRRHEPTTINENMLCILDVPRERLPLGAALDYLLEAAAAGEDVYCYAPMQLEKRPERQRWNVWLNGQRWDLDEWLEHFYSRPWEAPKE